MIGIAGRHGALVAHDVVKDIEQGPERAPPNFAMAPPNKKLCAWPNGVVKIEQGQSKLKVIHNSSHGEPGHHAVRAAEEANGPVNAHVWDLDARGN